LGVLRIAQVVVGITAAGKREEGREPKGEDEDRRMDEPQNTVAVRLGFAALLPTIPMLAGMSTREDRVAGEAARALASLSPGSDFSAVGAE
jgi:hypothetical protein